MERKREYDRQRMGRLHRAGETWWQRRDRSSYDLGRSLANGALATIGSARDGFGVELGSTEFWLAARLIAGRQALCSERISQVRARLDELNGLAVVSTGSVVSLGQDSLSIIFSGRLHRMPEDMAPARYRRKPTCGSWSTGWGPRRGHWSYVTAPGEYDGKSTGELQRILSDLGEQARALRAERPEPPWASKARARAA